MNYQDIPPEIINWARWANPRPSLQTCGSIEKRYRAPWRQWINLMDLPNSPPIDSLRAQWFEVTIWRNLPWSARMAMKSALVLRHPQHKIARMSGVKYQQVAETITLAIDKAKRAIDKANRC